MSHFNTDGSDQPIDMQADSWRQIYLTGRDLILCLVAVAAAAAAAGYLAAKFFN